MVFNWDTLAKTSAVLLGAVATILGAVNSCSINDQKAALDSLKFQSDTNHQFAAAVDRLHDLLAKEDKVGGGNRPMVEFAGLYSIANVQQKLILFEMALIAKQNRALDALSALAENDDAIRSPAPADQVEAEKINDTIGTLDQRAKANIALATTPGPLQIKPADDPPLTQSKNATVRANANVIAALPVGAASGWVFIGDASGTQLNAYYAELDAITRTTTARSVPHSGAPFIACRDVNIRAVPLQASGTLGPIVSIARPGTVMKAIPDSANVLQQRIRARSVLNSRKPITARWIHISVTSQGPAPSC
jgi:hypothetical protein